MIPEEIKLINIISTGFWQKPTPTFVVTFCSWSHERLTRGLRRKTKKKVCWSEIGSDSQKLVFQRTFYIMHMSCSYRKKYKNNKIPNKQPASACQPAFENHSQSLTNNVFSSFFFLSLSCAWWKGYFFHNFQMFFIVLDHANACASMHLLVKIHNIVVTNQNSTSCKILISFWL